MKKTLTLTPNQCREIKPLCTKFEINKPLDDKEVFYIIVDIETTNFNEITKILELWKQKNYQYRKRLNV